MFGMGFGWLFGIALVGFVIWSVLKGRNSEEHHHVENKSALDLLKERYASGEINKEEFDERKRVLLS
jgi:putative membrane protein